MPVMSRISSCWYCARILAIHAVCVRLEPELAAAGPGRAELVVECACQRCAHEGLNKPSTRWGAGAASPGPSLSVTSLHPSSNQTPPPPPPPSTRRTLSRARDHYITVGSRLHGGTNVMTRRRSRSSRGGGGSARGFRGLSAWPGRRQLGRCGAEVRGGDGAGAGARCGAAGGGAP